MGTVNQAFVMATPIFLSFRSHKTRKGGRRLLCIKIICISDLLRIQ